MPSRPLDPAAVTAIVQDAAAAPSLHNAQPWKFRLLRENGVLQLRADPTRAMPAEDPANRALHLGCGAALFNLRVAAARQGCEPVTALLPDGSDPALLAEVRLDLPVRPDDDLAALHPAVSLRHTSRFPFTDEPIPVEVLDGLCAAALLEGCRLAFPDDWHVQTVLDLVHDAEDRAVHDPEARAELARWTRTEAPDGAAGNRPGDGIPADAFGPRPRGTTGPMRDFAQGAPVPGRESASFERYPRLGLLGTAEDRPVDWLRAGQAMERVLLQATLDGLAASLTSQALEWPELRWAVRDPGSATGQVQMVLRLGYGPEGTPTPRRPVDDILEIR
ncbi:Acg family FMN-binding oxidoreductase [Streptomyces albipurpureus]|uniref:Nitroreductase n=1 Tax=Streptomyces albipurpureus TaxID=2897419 RepID=A0ABT0ULW9_9ACTN|nr:nitroreductase [Streptomyces sp. CWNU-1]MCM2389326.1 nitroreductase [Streptomyces sp. CWNU-1]